MHFWFFNLSVKVETSSALVKCAWCSQCAMPPCLQDFLETLEDLDLSYNNLVDIPWDTIALLVSVNTLSLDHNLIESVPEGIFSNLHKLARYVSDHSTWAECNTLAILFTRCSLWALLPLSFGSLPLTVVNSADRRAVVLFLGSLFCLEVGHAVFVTLGDKDVLYKDLWFNLSHYLLSHLSIKLGELCGFILHF